MRAILFVNTDDIALISSTQQQLDDLDFTDDIALISSTQQQLDDLDFTDDIVLISSTGLYRL
jgi:hypothetical protein